MDQQYQNPGQDQDEQQSQEPPEDVVNREDIDREDADVENEADDDFTNVEGTE